MKTRSLQQSAVGVATGTLTTVAAFLGLRKGLHRRGTTDDEVVRRLPAQRRKHPSYNRVVLRIAGRKGSPFALVEHVGRRSGRVYRTPVEALPTPDGFVIALGHGPECDWCRNILAARTCTIVRNGVTYAVADPAVIDLAAALPLLSRIRRWLYQRSGATNFLRLRHVAQSQRSSDPAPDQVERAAA